MERLFSPIFAYPASLIHTNPQVIRKIQLSLAHCSALLLGAGPQIEDLPNSLREGQEVVLRTLLPPKGQLLMGEEGTSPSHPQPPGHKTEQNKLTSQKEKRKSPINQHSSTLA